MTNTNINTIDLTPVLEGIISLVIAVFSIIVDAAEQIYANTIKSGISKKKYVMELAKTKLAELGYSFDDKEIEAYLEQAVRDMNKDKDADVKAEM